MSPGLVNAHTHLSLTALQGLLEPERFEQWLPKLVSGLSGWTAEDRAASAALGAQLALASGVTVVGDITYGFESPAASIAAGLGGTFYWEVLGIHAAELYARLESIGYPGTDGAGSGNRTKYGLSPHSAYTSGPGLLAAVHEAAREMRAPIAIHVAESAAEVELLRRGTGPLADSARRLAPDLATPGQEPVEYLDRLGVLDGATVVHLCEMQPSDATRLAATVRGAVTCPRSNRFLSNSIPPVSRLLAAGVPVGIGTDSAASNSDLDLMAEVRALQQADTSLTAEQLIGMVTTTGAIALGCEEHFGALEPGMEADLSVFRIGASSDPYADFVARAGTSTLEAVMSAGEWRIRSGRPIDEAAAHSIREAATRSAEKARAAIA